MPSIAPAEAFALIGPWADQGFVLGRDGSLSVFLELSGRDPDGLGEDDHATTMMLARNATAALPSDIRCQTYYWHTEEPVAAPRPRQQAIVDRIESARYEHLSAKRLYRSRLFTVLTAPTTALAGSLDAVTWITTLMLAPVDAAARARIRQAITNAGQHAYVRDALKITARSLTDSVELFRRRWSGVGHATLMSIDEAWACVRALGTLSPAPFTTHEPAPEDAWYTSVLHGQAYSCQVAGVECVRVEVPQRYARIASIARLTGKTRPGWWCMGHPSPLTIPGDFILCVNSRGLSPIERAGAFFQAGNELQRQRLNLLRMLSNKAADPDDPARQLFLRKQGELLEAEDGDDSYSRAHLIVAALGNTAEAARDTAMALDASLSQASVLPVWESAGALDAYLALQPGAKPYEPRALMLNSFQTAATGLHYKIHQGATRVEEVGGDEPVMVLETKDGQPYGFSPWVGEKATIIGIGPPGSGKTFFQNLTGAHWGKYRGLFVTADFDHGGEVVPRLYGQDGAIFDGAAGMNPFRAQGPVPGEFRAHMTRLCMAMLRANDDPAMQSLAAGEQAHIDRAIAQTVALPPHLQTLSNFVHHLPQELMAKFSRWVSTGEGRYSAYLDAEDDRVGRLDRLATAFNLTRIRDDDAARGPIVLELLWRVTTAFEDLSRLREPKKLKLDEARLALRDPIIGPYIAEKAVTWRKFKASLELWSQDPEHFATATHWDAIRGSASMFVFTAAPDLNADSYRSVFGLTATDVDTIRTLTPKREIYLVQAETGVRKRLIVDADADARRWASSTADQVAASLASTPALRVIEGGHRHAS